MKPSIHILIVVSACCLFSFAALAQGDNDYTNNRKNKNTGAPAKQEPTEKIIERIVGTWEVDRIYKGNKDISNTDTVGSNQTLVFDTELKYVSYSENEKIDSGKYRLNENHSILYLESASGGEPHEWRVGFTGNGMTLQPIGNSPHAANFKYFYNKTGAARKAGSR
jgi:hypothetical protein